jgi:predicted membrane protein
MNVSEDRPRIIIGIVLLALGGLFLLSNLGILRGLSVWALLWGGFWLWLGAVVWGPRGRRAGASRMALGLLLIAIGVTTVVDGLGVFSFSTRDVIGRFWPVILIAIGLAILVESNRRQIAAGDPGRSNRIVHDSIFGDLKLTQPGWQARDVSANTLIGDMQIDLARAQVPDGETVVDLNAVIGDIDVWVPPDLPVALEAQCVFVTVNHFGRSQDIVLRRHVEVPEGFDLAARRVRVRTNIVFGDVNLTRAG